MTRYSLIIAAIAGIVVATQTEILRACERVVPSCSVLALDGDTVEKAGQVTGNTIWFSDQHIDGDWSTAIATVLGAFLAAVFGLASTAAWAWYSSHRARRGAVHAVLAEMAANLTTTISHTRYLVKKAGEPSTIEFTLKAHPGQRTQALTGHDRVVSSLGAGELDLLAKYLNILFEEEKFIREKFAKASDPRGVDPRVYSSLVDLACLDVLETEAGALQYYVAYFSELANALPASQRPVETEGMISDAKAVVELAREALKLRGRELGKYTKSS